MSQGRKNHKNRKNFSFRTQHHPAHDALGILEELSRYLRPQYECRICGTELRYDQRQFDNWVIHKNYCPWSRAERLLGLRPPPKEFYPGGAKMQKDEA